jgi:hypothetical protein
MRELGENETVVEMIRHACVAGGLRAMVRRQPDCARGLNKAADFHSTRAATLAADFCQETAIQLMTLASQESDPAEQR